MILLLFISLTSSCERENFDVIDPFAGQVTPDTAFCTLSVEVSYVGGVLVPEITDGTEPFSYLWSTEETDPLIFVEEPGTYQVTVTDADGCTAIDSQRVATEEECAEIVVTITESIQDDQRVLTAEAMNGEAPYFYSWGEEAPPGPTFIPPEPGEYEVLVGDAAGCIVSVSYFFE
ncbi:MAG: hypothetical protein AAF840_07290 [Bacteroidota bacterium]